MAASGPNPHRARLEAMFRGAAQPFPLARRLGLKFVGLRPGRAVIELPVTPRLHNPLGVLHGGVIMALLDTAMGFAATSLLEGHARTDTVDVKVSFIRGVIEGRLRVEAKVLRRGRNLLPIEAKAYDQEGRLVAQALGSALVRQAGLG